jgi:4,5-dihydroxyphthalate decarboxylase
MADANMVLKTALGTYGNTEALKSGRIKIPGITLEYSSITPTFKAFKPMVENLEFDVSEMAITTYLLARAFDRNITLLPVVVMRRFQHNLLAVNRKSGILEPKDLVGKKVGVRAYTQTTGVWLRGVLERDYGVDFRKIAWVTYEGAHVSAYKDPEWVERAPEGKTLAGMLASGEIDAAIGAGKVDSPDVHPLWPNVEEVEAEYYRRTGIYPVNHMVVVKSELADANPTLMRTLFDAFKASREEYLNQLRAQGPSTPEDEATLRMQRLVGDPLPIGVEANRKAIETVVLYAFEQKILPRPYTVEQLFDASVMDSQ